jgi:hypothetical protein
VLPGLGGAGPDTIATRSCPLRARSEGDWRSIAVTRGFGLVAPTSSGAGRDAGRTIFASRWSAVLHYCGSDDGASYGS